MCRTLWRQKKQTRLALSTHTPPPPLCLLSTRVTARRALFSQAGETFKQSWPVTPYTLRLKSHYHSDCWFQVFIDGNKSIGKSIRAFGTVDCKGFQAKPGQGVSEEREMLFTRPRLLRSTDACVHDPSAVPTDPELASIRVEFFLATRRETRAGFSASTGGVVEGCHKLAASKSKVGATTRSGVVIKAADSNGISTVFDVDWASKVGEVRIRYATKAILQAPVTPCVWSEPARSAPTHAEETTDGVCEAGSIKPEPGLRSVKRQRRAVDAEDDDDVVDLT